MKACIKILIWVALYVLGPPLFGSGAALAAFSTTSYVDTVEVTAVGTYAQWSVEGGADAVDCVDEDSDTKYIHAGIDEYSHSFTMSSWTPQGSGWVESISYIKATYRVKEINVAGADGAVFFKIAGDTVSTPEITNPGDVWVTDSATISRPGGGSWGESDIAVMEVGISKKGPVPSSRAIGCSRLFIAISYQVYDSSDTLQTSATTKDAYTIQTDPTYNTGASTIVLTGNTTTTNTDNYLYLWFDIPTPPSGLAIAACTLRVSPSAPGGWGTVDEHNILALRSTRDVNTNVGDNTGSAADAGEMNWTYYSSPSSAWTSAGGDFDITPNLGSVSTGSSLTNESAWWPITSAFIDSIAQGTSTNTGMWLVGDGESAEETRVGWKSTDNSGHDTVLPTLFLWLGEAEAEGPAGARRRRIILGGN